jgi:uncharacterized protein YeaO (DUF488 family)
MKSLSIKRVYSPASPDDGYRILVDRLWPRGLKKSEAQVDKWLKEVAPSTSLRMWFNHEPAKWLAFRWRYKEELKANAALDELLGVLKVHGRVTLLYSATDLLHNNAVALKEFLETEC